MENAGKKYFAYHVRWQHREGFLLWMDLPEPGRESLWTDAQNKVPIFDTYQQLNSFALGLNKQLQKQEA